MFFSKKKNKKEDEIGFFLDQLGKIKRVSLKGFPLPSCNNWTDLSSKCFLNEMISIGKNLTIERLPDTELYFSISWVALLPFFLLSFFRVAVKMEILIFPWNWKNPSESGFSFWANPGSRASTMPLPNWLRNLIQEVFVSRRGTQPVEVGANDP